ncbi:hypothetical protein ACM66B_004373 [Microbotryomycetes sp. NB124-2]
MARAVWAKSKPGQDHVWPAIEALPTELKMMAVTKAKGIEDMAGCLIDFVGWETIRQVFPEGPEELEMFVHRWYVSIKPIRDFKGTKIGWTLSPLEALCHPHNQPNAVIIVRPSCKVDNDDEHILQLRALRGIFRGEHITVSGKVR